MSDTDTPPPPGDMVPKSRLAQESEKLRAAQAEVARLTRELNTANGKVKAAESKASTHDSILARNAELEEQVKQLEATGAEDLELVRRGFSDVALVRFEHQRAGSDVGTVVEWVDKLKEQKPDNVPANLRPFLEASGGDDKPPGDKAGGTTRDSNAGADNSGNPPGEGEQTQARARELYTEALRTGDWTAYKQYRGIKDEASA